MGYEYFADKYEEFADEHEKLAERLTSVKAFPPGPLELQNERLAKKERDEAQRCRSTAEEYRNLNKD